MLKFNVETSTISAVQKSELRTENIQGGLSMTIGLVSARNSSLYRLPPQLLDATDERAKRVGFLRTASD